jgi:hypothetical protein
MTEARVIKKTIAFLESEGWRVTNKGKRKNEGGIDIKGYRHGRSIWIEAKGDRKRRLQTIHNSFISAMGQILFRMDQELRYRYYGIAIPSSWERTWKKKIQKMRYAWKQLGIRIYLVYENGSVEWKNSSKMLKV